MSVEERIQSWLTGPFDPKMQDELRHLLEVDPKSLEDAFFKDLSFGTGGMRGIMGIGTNRLNIYTIQMATQGLANYIKKQAKENHSVFIGYDVRNHSREFAEEAAKVLSGNGIQALLSKDICPTPLTSFACRHFGCTAAIMITASHNPPQYNGYRVYWSDGCQVVPPHDKAIMEEVTKIKSPTQVLLSSEYVEIGSEIDDAYLLEVKKLQLLPEMAQVPLNIIYTNLHGTGIRLIPKALQICGYTHLRFVEKQLPLDGNFTYAPSPNPEEEKALRLGIDQLQREGADLLMATDPDADRIGVVAANTRLNGNQIGCLCLHHICKTMKEKGIFPTNAAVIKSIVTTELFKAIAESYGAKCVDVLTGFKYIGEQIGIWEKAFDGYTERDSKIGKWQGGAHTLDQAQPAPKQRQLNKLPDAGEAKRCGYPTQPEPIFESRAVYQYLFGAEESYGYLFGTFVRDKDAISTACLIAEMAASAKKEGKTLVNILDEIYQEYGIYRESLINLTFEDSQEGIKHMQALMQRLRNTPPLTIAEQNVSRQEDFSQGYEHFPPSDVLRYWLEDGTKVVIRPSGTEPKVKIYVEVVGAREERMEEVDLRLEKITNVLKKLAH